MHFALVERARHAAPLLLIVALMAAGSAARGADATLFERLGGRDKIVAAAAEIVDAVSHDPRTSRGFEGVKLAPLKVAVAEHLCAITGGPCVYRGDTMPVAHRGLAISDEQFDVMGGHVELALVHQGVAVADRRELEAILEGMRSEVVGK